MKAATIPLVLLFASSRLSMATVEAPLATTGKATELTGSSATLNATVNPRGTDTTVTFEYGTTTAYGSTTTSVDAGSGSVAVAETAPISGLASGTTYHYRVVAAGATTVDGADKTFLTVGPQIATTPGTPLLSASGAEVNWGINPKGVLTGVYFAYGTASNNLNLQTVVQDVGAGGAVVNVIGFLGELQPSTTYYYQVVAVANGITYTGPIESLTTLAFNTTLVAQSRDTADDTSGAQYGLFGDVAINDNVNDGNGVAFTSSLIISASPVITGANDLGIWANEGSSALRLIAQTDETAPGTASATFETLGDPVYNENNAVAFAAQLNVVKNQATAATEMGVWSTSSGALELVAREGSAAPGGTTFRTFQAVQLSDAKTIVVADMAPGTGVTAANEFGIWEGTQSNDLALKLRAGDVVGGKTISSMSLISSNTLLQGQTRDFASNTGDLAVLATLSGGTTGIVTNFGGTEALAESVASTVPGISGAVFSKFGSPIINDSDHLAFEATLAVKNGVTAATDAGIWADNAAGTLELVAQTGQTTGTDFTSLSDPLDNDNDAVAFLADYKSGSKILTGIFCNSTGTMAQVAQIGAQAPGCPTSTNFHSFVVMGLADGGGATNNGGVVFEGTLTGTGVTSANYVGIWAVDSTGTLQLIVRTGDNLNLGTTNSPVFKTISNLAFLPYSSSLGGQTRGLAKSEALAYTATFSDGSTAIFNVVFP